MQWIERFGGYLALSLLAFMWPVIDAPQKGLVPSDYAALFALSAGAYVVVYSWYCLWGHTRRNAAVPVGTVLVLTLLALVLQHLVGMPNFNYLLIPLAVAGFALAPRLALLSRRLRYMKRDSLARSEVWKVMLMMGRRIQRLPSFSLTPKNNV